MSKDSDEERQELQKLFDSHDKNNNGLLEYNEFTLLVEDIIKEGIGPTMTPEEIQTAFNNIDNDKNSLVDFEEFYLWLDGQKY